MQSGQELGQESFLIVRARAWLCGLPLGSAVETMRVLSIEPVVGAPSFVRGLSIIRGAALPVVDLGALLGAPSDRPGGRLVTVRAGERQVALQVDEVLGARRLDAGTFEQAPPLCRGVLADHVAAIGALDRRLLTILETSHLIPEALWSALKGA